MDPDQDLLPDQPEEPRPPAMSQRERARLIGSVVLGGLLAAFALLNLGSVKVDWIVGSAHSPLIVVIIVSVVIGIAIDRVAVIRARKRSRPPE